MAGMLINNAGKKGFTIYQGKELPGSWEALAKLLKQDLLRFVIFIMEEDSRNSIVVHSVGGINASFADAIRALPGVEALCLLNLGKQPNEESPALCLLKWIPKGSDRSNGTTLLIGVFTGNCFGRLRTWVYRFEEDLGLKYRLLSMAQVDIFRPLDSNYFLYPPDCKRLELILSWNPEAILLLMMKTVPGNVFSRGGFVDLVTKIINFLVFYFNPKYKIEICDKISEFEKLNH